MKKRKSKINPDSMRVYAKYTNLGFQMLFVILLGVFGGIKLDEIITALTFPVFTVSFSILSVVLSIYIAIKDLLK